MNKIKRSSLENLLLSVLGHLVVAAVSVTSVVTAVNEMRLVSPDRIEIMEIDLDAVQVGGETVLYNLGETKESEKKSESDSAESQPLQTEQVPERVADSLPPEPPVVPAEPEPKSEPVADAAPIETPSLVESTPPPHGPVTEPEKKPEPVKESEPVSAPPVPAQKKRTVVRVNREVVSLNRTLTVSVIDALRVAMTRCWNIDTTRADIADIRAVAHLTLRKNGTVRDVWFESVARAETDAAFAYVLDTIRSAIDVCQPFKMLPVSEYAEWNKIQLTFYPTQGKVM